MIDGMKESKMHYKLYHHIMIDIPNMKTKYFDTLTLRKLQAAVSHDPEIDLTAQMPTDYTNRLIRMQNSKEVLGK